MAEYSGFFNAELVNGEYDRTYLAETFAKYFSLFVANGVFPNPSDGIQVFENTTPDMNVLVHPGYGWINGYWYQLDNNHTLAIDPADGVLNRIDRIVVRWDLEEREVYLTVLKGTPASSPSAPDIVRSADYYDLCVAEIAVDAGITQIRQSMITDTRTNSDLCGIVTGVVQSIDTTTLFNQYQAALSEFEETKLEEFDEWSTEQQQAFNDWFANIQDILDENTAGNLLNLINQETANRQTADTALETKIANNTGINATATHEGTTVSITAPTDVSIITFLAPSDWVEGETYTVNSETVELVDLNGEAVEDAWKKNSPVTITVSGGKAFFKAGGGSKIPNDLPPLLPNFALEFSGTTVTVTANKLPLNDKTSMLSGGVWVLASTIPDSPKGAIVKEWSQSDLIDSTQDTESSEIVTWTYENWSAGEPIYCRQYTYNEKGQYNTALYGGLVSTEDVTFKLPEFTGNHAIFGDEVAGRIELYESGTLTLYPGTYDFFLVGGGSNGNNAPSGPRNGAGGGAGGYTKTVKGVVIEKLTPMISVLVGAANSKSAITIGDQSYEALPGSASSARYESGKNGGSGGGVGMYDDDNAPSRYAPGLGGSDGSNGESNSYNKFVAGTGQGTTTRAFEEASGTLFAGGGSGGTTSGRGYYAKPATEGGGGPGGNGSNSNRNGGNATPNTGGGGGGAAAHGSSGASGGLGGSGIIIIRWNNVA